MNNALLILAGHYYLNEPSEEAILPLEFFITEFINKEGHQPLGIIKMK
jgi:hypothetical protein